MTMKCPALGQALLRSTRLPSTRKTWPDGLALDAEDVS